MIADVEAQLGPETENRLFSALGGMRGGSGTGMTGTVPEDDTYLIRAACSTALGAELIVSQAGAQVLKLSVACGVPREALVDLRSGPVSASLEQLGPAGRSMGALRLEKTHLAPVATPSADECPPYPLVLPRVGTSLAYRRRPAYSRNMPATQGALWRRNAVSVQGSCPPGMAGPRTQARAVVALWTAGVLVLGILLTGCEYSFDEGRSGPDPGSSAGPALPDPAFTRELEDEPVTEAEMDSWLKEALPETEREVIRMASGLLNPGEVRTEKAQDLPVGTYTLALVCKSERRVNFTVRTDEYTLVDLGLRCGPTRENVIYLSRESALTFRVESRSAANFAIRLTRL
jgi:hypothetical protein